MVPAILEVLMRLVGIALLSAWLLAWWAAPHGEVAPATSIVGGVAVAGGERAAVAWLELRRGSPDRSGLLHVATVDEADRVTPALDLPVSGEAVAFRLAEAGEGTFVLASEFRDDRSRWFELRRIGGGRVEKMADLPALLGGGTFDLAAAGSELVLAERDEGQTRVHVLDAAGQWRDLEGPADAQIGSGGGHVVVYQPGRHQDRLLVAPLQPSWWEAQLRKPTCTRGLGDETKVRVVSVVGLRGGYARLSRAGNAGCLDGLRDGQPFAEAAVDLSAMRQPFVAANAAGELAIHDAADGRGSLPRGTAALMSSDARVRSDELTRYRVFGSGGREVVTALSTHIAPQETRVILERLPLDGRRMFHAQVLGPVRRYQPDHRPALRLFALFPIAAFALAALSSARWVRRLAALRLAPADLPLGAGPAVVEGTLATDADAPAGGLRLRRGGGGRSPVTLLIDGAEVLRASDLRPRDQPRGDAVDVAAGAPVVATGTVRPGSLFRGDTTLHAGRGDLVIVGCSLGEVRARMRGVFTQSLGLLGVAVAILAAVILRG